MADAERLGTHRKEPDEVRGIHEDELKKGASLGKQQLDSYDKAAASLCDLLLDPRTSQGASTEDKFDTILREIKGLRQEVEGLHRGMEGLQRNQKVLTEQQETQAVIQAYIFAVTSPYDLQQSPSSAEISREMDRIEENLASDFYDEYRLSRGSIQGQGCFSLCQATGKVLLDRDLVLEHLLPAESARHGVEWGITDPASDIRTILLWYDGVHEAWKALRICLEFNGDRLRIRVLDSTLLDKCLVDLVGSRDRTRAARDVLGDMTFRDLDEQEIYFPAEVKTRPYQQIIATQAANAITKMWKLGRLRGDIEKFRIDVTEDFPQKQACLMWIRTIMKPIPDWPVGPEPTVKMIEVDEAG